MSTLGDREEGAVHLEEAVAAYRAALGVYTWDEVPFHWARTQVNLGVALLALARREQGADHLRRAIAAFHAALRVFTQDRLPIEWAETQHHLGNALRVLGEREDSTLRLGEAVCAYQAASPARPPPRPAPGLGWAPAARRAQQ